MISYDEFTNIKPGTWVKIHHENHIEEKDRFFPYHGEFGVWERVEVNDEQRQATKSSKDYYQLYLSNSWYITRNIVAKIAHGMTKEEIMEKYPEVSRHLFEILATRLHRADEITVNLINERLQQR